MIERFGGYLLRHRTAGLLLLLVIALVYYSVLLTHGSLNLFNPTWHGATFDSMLLHLSQGRFDVDPATIGSEGFVRDGRTYAYFGIFCAILRAPMLLFPGLQHTNLTLVSCLIADAIIVACQAWLTLELFRRDASGRGAVLLVPLLLLAFLAGPQVYMLRPSVYQEVAYWSLALAYLFVTVLLGMVMLDRPATVARLTALALLAGLEVNTRVTTGAGLYAATVIAALMLGGQGRSLVGRLAGLRVWLPFLMLILFGVAVGYVNYMRWGNALEFNDPHRDLSYDPVINPGALARIETYGTFNPARIGLGLLYYFLPIWLIRGVDGNPLFTDFRHRMMDFVELPPSSFIITDALWLVFATYLIVLLVRDRRAIARPGTVCLLAVGLALPAGAMLCFMAFSLRYRAEFYPAMLFMGFLGLQAFLRRARRSDARLWVWPLAGMGIVAAPLLLVLYDASPFGSGLDEFARDGWIASYRQRITAGVSQAQAGEVMVRGGAAAGPHR